MQMRASRPVCGVVMAVLVSLAAGCSGQMGTPDPPATTPEAVYDIRGVVVATDPGRRILEIDHEEIPGFMPAMTMPYEVSRRGTGSRRRARRSWRSTTRRSRVHAAMTCPTRSRTRTCSRGWPRVTASGDAPRRPPRLHHHGPGEGLNNRRGRLAFHRGAWCTGGVMRRASRPIALVLLVMAVLCSPARVCVIYGMVGTMQPRAGGACARLRQIHGRHVLRRQRRVVLLRATHGPGDRPPLHPAEAGRRPCRRIRPRSGRADPPRVIARRRTAHASRPEDLISLRRN